MKGKQRLEANNNTVRWEFLRLIISQKGEKDKTVGRLGPAPKILGILGWACDWSRTHRCVRRWMVFVRGFLMQDVNTAIIAINTSIFARR